jgi:ribosomal protein S12 methylthiotransferase accessory factor
VTGGPRLLAREPTPLSASLPRLDTLVSPYTGLVQAVHPLLAAPADARLVRMAATTPAAVRIARAERGALDDGSGGYAPSSERARAAAIGEAAERYAGSMVPESSLVLATAAELGRAAVSPERFALFAPHQYARPGFPFVPFTKDVRIRWARGFSIPGGEEVFLPAQLVYLSWRRIASSEARIAYSTSSGLACGPTLTEAVLFGLLELVERDAFMLMWNNRLSLPRLDWRGDASLGPFVERYLAPTGARFTTVDLSGFLAVPVTAAIVEGDGETEPALAVGAGCAATIRDAVVKAVAEAFAVRSWGRTMLQAPGADGLERPIATFADHIRFYLRRPRAERARFLTASARAIGVREIPSLVGTTALDQIEEIAAKLAGQGAHAYAVDVTTPDLRDAGLAVAKVVSPELCSLDVHHDARFLGGTRLYRLPVGLGLRETPATSAELNPDPHPFP